MSQWLFNVTVAENGIPGKFGILRSFAWSMPVIPFQIATAAHAVGSRPRGASRTQGMQVFVALPACHSAKGQDVFAN